MSRRVLVLAYDFPPAGGGGVQRTTKFVRYLPDFGWDPTVLTVANPLYLLTDPSLEAQVPEGTRVERAAELLPNRLLLRLRARLRGSRPGAAAGAAGPPGPDAAGAAEAAGAEAASGLSGASAPSGARGLARRMFMGVARTATPDIHAAWIPAAAARARRIARREGMDAVLATAPPFSAMVAARLATRGAGGPALVLDYRDAWSLNPLRVGTAKARRELPLERWVLRGADRVVFATERMRADYRAAFPDGAERFRTVMNGYDEADFEGLEAAAAEELTLTYTGRVTEKLRLRPVAEALARVAARRGPAARPIRLRFVGDVYATQQRVIDEAGIRHLTRFDGYLPHRAALETMLAADVLLLLGSGDPAEMTGKVFEYLRAGRPILAAVPVESEAGRLVARAGHGAVAPPDAPGALEAALEAMLAAADADRSARELAISPIVRDLERRAQAGRLAAILDDARRERS